MRSSSPAANANPEKFWLYATYSLIPDLHALEQDSAQAAPTSFASACQAKRHCAIVIVWHMIWPAVLHGYIDGFRLASGTTCLTSSCASWSMNISVMQIMQQKIDSFQPGQSCQISDILLTFRQIWNWSTGNAASLPDEIGLAPTHVTVVMPCFLLTIFSPSIFSMMYFFLHTTTRMQTDCLGRNQSRHAKSI